MDDLLRLLFLFVENASRRFSYRCMAAATAVETVRDGTVTGQPFANLSSVFQGFSGFTATDGAVNSAPKNGIDHP
ncbi:hypothetical protein [Pseudomonas sp. NPDC089569]|uniref:hypothetical protein n=1 Tax=Pseudomonas sp. NPDC089569 TaxID=3390722 RepID=UPI003D056086